MARVVVVSNRISLPNARGRPRAGGLTVVLKNAIKVDSLWFGWSGKTTEETSAEAKLVSQNGIQYATVDLSEDDYRRFYVGFSNGTLWPLLHFQLGRIEFRREHLEGYRRVNERFAMALKKLLRPDDLIWAHDYHLIPLASALRALGVKNRIGFYLHVPFVPSSVFAALPQGDGLLRDLCTYDVVGFQTPEHQHDFLDTVSQMLPFLTDREGSIVTPHGVVASIVAPVGIDGPAFRDQAQRSASGKNCRRLIDSLVGRSLMIGVDRLDYSKGLPNRFEAFNRLLTRFPEHKQHVSYLQIAAPSREDVAEYAALRPELSRLAGDINGRHGAFDWVPLRYMSQNVARSTLAGFYRVARVGVVTPWRDGMNLVAHEYVAAQDPSDPGVLILSRFAGAASYFDEALIVNPYDPDEVAEAMDQALSMPLDERRQRHAALYERVRAMTAEAYCETFLKALSSPRGGAANHPFSDAWLAAAAV
ncbi:MAG TPA: trehalose-6-phosphate synthase [Caulobacteraceae bacterium]|nr:trehalose-6-phosphate synthase [Caulobacteraceae bacterium]